MIRSRHKTALIKMMWDRTGITAGRVFGISNANQYLVELFREKIVKFRWCTDANNHKRRFKLWRIDDFQKAKRYLGGKI